MVTGAVAGLTIADDALTSSTPFKVVSETEEELRIKGIGSVIINGVSVGGGTFTGGSIVGSMVNSHMSGGSVFSVGGGGGTSIINGEVYVNGRRMVPADGAAPAEEEEGVKEHKAAGTITSVSIEGSAEVTGSLEFIKRVRISGSGNFSAASTPDLLIKSFTGSISGSGDIDLGGNTIGVVRVSVTGSGDICGFTARDEVEASVTGSGDIRGTALRGADVDKSCIGSGSIRITKR